MLCRWPLVAGRRDVEPYYDLWVGSMRGLEFLALPLCRGQWAVIYIGVIPEGALCLGLRS